MASSSLDSVIFSSRLPVPLLIQLSFVLEAASCPPTSVLSFLSNRLAKQTTFPSPFAAGQGPAIKFVPMECEWS